MERDMPNKVIDNGKKYMSVGGGVQDIEVDEDEFVVGSNGVIHKPAENFQIEDPKFAGGIYPGFDR